MLGIEDWCAHCIIDEWVKLTEGFTLDHLKELILLTFVLENKFDDSLSKIKEMLKNPVIKNVGIKGAKQTIGFAKFGTVDFKVK